MKIDPERMKEWKVNTLPVPSAERRTTEPNDIAGKIAALRSESEERTAKLDALEALVLLAKENAKESSK
jgi:hypothetical protein